MKNFIKDKKVLLKIQGLRFVTKEDFVYATEAKGNKVHLDLFGKAPPALEL